MTGREVDLTHAAAMPAPQGGALPTGLEWQALERMATMLADSNLIPYKLKKKPGDIAVVLLAAREYGIPPLMALSKLPVVNGTPAPMGELMVALVLRAGHSINATVYNPDGSLYAGGPVEPGTYAACVSKRRDEDEPQELRFTLQEALTAGLVDRILDGKAIARVTKQRDGRQVEERTPWEQYTANMLRWRAVANACRLRFPDVLLGLSYLPEELGAEVDADGYPVDLGPAQTVTRVAPSVSLEERTALEVIAKLDEQPWADHVLDMVLANAEEGGYIDTPVPDGDDRITVREAVGQHIAARADVVQGKVDEPATDQVDPDELDKQVREWVTNLNAATYDNEFLLSILDKAKAAGFDDHEVDGTTIAAEVDRLIAANAAPSPEPETPQAGQNGPQAGREPLPAAEEPSEPDQEPQKAEQPAPSGPPGLTAEDYTIVILEEADKAILKDTYDAAKAADLLSVNVLEYLDDDDRATLGVPPGIDTVLLGGLVTEVVKYVNRHQVAVRHVAEPSSDPWAADQLQPGEEPPPGWL